MRYRKFTILRIGLLVLIISIQTISHAQPGGISPVAFDLSNESIRVQGNAGMSVSAVYQSQHLEWHVGLNFPLATGLGSCILSGHVHTADSLLEDGRLYILDAGTGNTIDSAVISRKGFETIPLPAGDVYLLAVPLGKYSQTYIPTYYVNKATREEAHALSIPANSIEVGDLDFHMILRDELKYTANGYPYLEVFPSPASGTLNVRIFTVRKSSQLPFKLEVIDLHGKTLLLHEGETEQSTLQFSLSIQHLDPGLYFIRFAPQNKVPVLIRFLKI